MAKDQNVYREDLDKEESSYSEEIGAAQEADAQLDPEESTFKKRYGDLRRHMQQTLTQKDAQIAQMQAQLDSATRKQIKFPKTEEEVAQWAARYPDVAEIFSNSVIVEMRLLNETDLKETCIQYLKKFPRSVDIMFNVAGAYEGIKEYETSMELYKKLNYI